MVDLQILIGILVSILPVFEIRVGLPIIIEHVVRKGFSIWPYFFIVVILNILVVLLIFLLFDFAHKILMKWKWYRIRVGGYLLKLRTNVDKIESKMDKYGYLALTLFVVIPLPGTGSWTGSLIAWVMKLNRVRSFFAIAGGIIISSLVVLLISLGIFESIY